MEIYETVLLSAFDTTMILIFMHSILKRLHTSIIEKVLYIGVSAILIALSSYFIQVDSISHVISTLAGYAVFMTYLWKNKFREIASSTLLFLLISLFILVVQLLIIIIISSIVKPFEYSFTNGLIAQALGIGLVLILNSFIPFSSIYIYIKEKNIAFRVIISTIFLLYYGISIIWYIDMTVISNALITLIMVTIFAVAINTILLREGFLSRIYQDKLVVYDTYLPIIDDIVEEFRKKQHDFHNHIQTLAVMSNGSADVEEYVDQIGSDNIWNDLLKLNNKIVLAFFYSKYIQAIDMGISVKYTIENYSFKSNYSNYQLVEIYGIIIDNAIEATSKYSDEKEMEIILSKKEGFNVFEVRNSYGYITSNEINNYFNTYVFINNQFY
jgi:hypothetical protein